MYGEERQERNWRNGVESYKLSLMLYTKEFGFYPAEQRLWGPQRQDKRYYPPKMQSLSQK